MNTLEDSLSSLDKLKLDKLNKIISYNDPKEQLLFLISTDTENLNMSFEEYFSSTLKNCIKIADIHDGLFKTILSKVENYKNKYILINLFSIDKYISIRDEFQFKRDYIPQEKLKFIFLLNQEQYVNFKQKAYDFFSFNNFFHLFIDNSFIFVNDIDLSELNNMIDEYEKIKDTNISKQSRMKYLFDIGKKAFNFSQYKISLEYLAEALHLATKLKDIFISAYILSLKGNIYLNSGDLKKALEYQKESLKISKKLKYQKGIATNLGNIGNVYMKLGNFELSLSNYKKALDISIKEKDKKNEANALGDIGSCYLIMGNLDLSSKYFNKSLSIYKDIKYVKGEASILLLIGNLCYEKNDLKLALRYFNESLIINKNIGYQSGIVNALKNIGTIYIDTNDFDLALKYQKEAKGIAKKLGFNGILTKIEKSIKNIEEKR